MNWIETIVSVKEKLKQHGFHQTAKRINDAQMVLGTPGEMYLEVMNELLAIRKKGRADYELIKTEINDLLEYGRSINYFNPKK